MRVMFLLLLISAGIYIYAQVRQDQVENPFVPTALPPTPTPSALSYITQAEELYLQGELGEAIFAYEQAISLEPDDVSAYTPLARLLALEGRTLEALWRAQQAVEMAPENVRAWAVLGMVYDWNGDVPEAIEACERAIELNPTYAESYAYLAEAYADAIRWAEAAEAAQTALELDDQSVDAHRNYGYLLEIQGNYSGALEEYEKALEIHPYLAYIRIAVGKNYRALGNIDAALDSFQRAATVDPDNARAQYELGWTYLINLGEYEQAQTYLELAIEADPQFGRAYGGLAITYWARRNYEDAIPNFEQAISLESAEARRNAREFYLTIEGLSSGATEPSTDVVMRGEFTPLSLDDLGTLQATLAPGQLRESDAAWANAQGLVTLNTRTGEYTLKLENLPRPLHGTAYVGWFDGVSTLSGDPLSTGRLGVGNDGSVDVQLETGWVAGPPIEDFYTLGLAYFYLDECQKSYPLFEAALRIDPEEPNALEGIRLCNLAEE